MRSSVFFLSLQNLILNFPPTLVEALMVTLRCTCTSMTDVVAVLRSAYTNGE